MKRAVVLSGGGSRGSYEIGVWKALKELNIDYQIVTGTSVGSLNGVMMVQGDYDVAVSMWESLTSENIVKLKLSADGKTPDDVRTIMRDGVLRGGADATPLKETLERVIRPDTFYDSPIDFGLVTVEYPSLRPLTLVKKEIPSDKLIDYLMASSACFPAFQVQRIEGTAYMDGGYYDNLPINLAVDMGADEIIAVRLQAVGREKVVKNKEVKITTITPYSGDVLGPFLYFDPSKAQSNIQRGYLDTLRAFGKYHGERYALEKSGFDREFKEVGPFFANAVRRLVYAHTPNYGLGSLAALLSVRRALGKYIDARQKPNLKKAFFRTVEFTAEALSLDEFAHYDRESFHVEILKKLETAKPLEPRIRRVIMRSSKKVGEGMKELGSLNRVDIVRFILEQLHKYWEGELRQSQIDSIAVVFPKLLLAALYCEGLTKWQQYKI